MMITYQKKKKKKKNIIKASPEFHKDWFSTLKQSFQSGECNSEGETHIKLHLIIIFDYI